MWRFGLLLFLVAGSIHMSLASGGRSTRYSRGTYDREYDDRGTRDGYKLGGVGRAALQLGAGVIDATRQVTNDVVKGLVGSDIAKEGERIVDNVGDTVIGTAGDLLHGNKRKRRSEDRYPKQSDRYYRRERSYSSSRHHKEYSRDRDRDNRRDGRGRRDRDDRRYRDYRRNRDDRTDRDDRRDRDDRSERDDRSDRERNRSRSPRRYRKPSSRSFSPDSSRSRRK